MESLHIETCETFSLVQLMYYVHIKNKKQKEHPKKESGVEQDKFIRTMIAQNI